MQYSQGQIKDLTLLLSERIEQVLTDEDPSELVPTWCCLLFLLDRLQNNQFFGDVVIPLRGGMCKEPYIQNQTFRMRQNYVEKIGEIMT